MLPCGAKTYAAVKRGLPPVEQQPAHLGSLHEVDATGPRAKNAEPTSHLSSLKPVEPFETFAASTTVANKRSSAG